VPDSQHDPFFLGRLATRESSTLTFSTVGASSSLVVLALVIDRGLLLTYPWLAYIGLLFSMLGIIYREATVFSIDRAEYHALTDELWNMIESEREPIFGRCMALTRRVAIRFFLWIPIVAWLSWLWNIAFSCVDLLLVVFPLLSIGLSLLGLNPKYRSKTPK
jgi:hypothetical protein